MAEDGDTVLTRAQQQLVLSLVVAPGRESERPSAAQLLAAFDASDGRALCVDLLERAVELRSADDVELVLVMATRFGMDGTFLPVLRVLAREPWHIVHQDICWDLEELGGADVVPELDFLAWAGPEFQDYEGSVALASKAVHALARIATPDARAALVGLREHPEPDIRALVDRLERRTRQ